MEDEEINSWYWGCAQENGGKCGGLHGEIFFPVIRKREINTETG